MKKKMSKTNKTLTAIVLALSLVVVSLLGVTAAWFTDSKSYTNKLEFGNVLLNVTDSAGAEMTKTITFDITRTNKDGTWTGKVMPGDTVKMSFNVGLKNESAPAYYLVLVTDTKGVFVNGTYFVGLDGKVYVNDGTKTYLQSDKDKTAITGDEREYVGALTKDDGAHAFELSVTIAEDYEDQGGSTDVSLNIFAIQQANLEKYSTTDTAHSAYHILTNKVDLTVNGVNLPSVNDLQSVVTNWTSLTSVGFYYTKDVSKTEYQLNDALTTSLNAKLDTTSAGKIKIYKKIQS